MDKHLPYQRCVNLCVCCRGDWFCGLPWAPDPSKVWIQSLMKCDFFISLRVQMERKWKYMNLGNNQDIYCKVLCVFINQCGSFYIYWRTGEEAVCVSVCVQYRFKIGMKSICLHLKKRKIDASDGTRKITVIKP